MSNLRTVLVIFVLFCLITKAVFILKTENSINENIGIVMAALVFSLVLMKVTCIKDTFVTGTNYETAATEGKDNKLLEITMAKQCLGGAYMHSGSDPLSVYCRNLAKTNPQEIADYTCGSWFNGYPLLPKQTEYTPESNQNWMNGRCSYEKPKPNQCNGGAGIF